VRHDVGVGGAGRVVAIGHRAGVRIGIEDVFQAAGIGNAGLEDEGRAGVVTVRGNVDDVVAAIFNGNGLQVFGIAGLTAAPGVIVVNDLPHGREVGAAVGAPLKLHVRKEASQRATVS